MNDPLHARDKFHDWSDTATLLAPYQTIHVQHTDPHRSTITLENQIETRTSGVTFALRIRTSKYRYHTYSLTVTRVPGTIRKYHILTIAYAKTEDTRLRPPTSKRQDQLRRQRQQKRFQRLLQAHKAQRRAAKAADAQTYGPR